jgi:hypothetical protein
MEKQAPRRAIDMKYEAQFPKISAQIFSSSTSKQEFYLFNSITNRGFSIDGLAASLCKEFTGEKKLSEIIESFEKENKLQNGIFDKEISDLISELEKNKLITFSTTKINT